MPNTKFASGAFVFTRARGLQPRDPEDLRSLAVRRGIDPAYTPGYLGDRTAIGRAISQASSGLHREGLLLRPIKRTNTEVLYGIVHERRDEAEQKLDHEFEATVAWSIEPDPATVRGEHPVAHRVAEAYGEVRGKIVADDWSSVITAYLESHDAARVRGDGRVYWIPPQRLPDVKKFGAFLAEVGIDLVLAEIEAEARTVVEAVAAESLDEQLADLEQEVAEFDGTQKPSTYARRLDEYQRLRQRANLYKDALGLGVEKAEKVLVDLEQRVQTMLDIRLQTVVHRDGTTSATAVAENSSEPTPTTPATPPATLRFANAHFTLADSNGTSLTFTSGDQAAQKAMTSLEMMGLAGRWQRVGHIEVRLQNSGPAGAETSIAIRLPEGSTLLAAGKSLAALGIELT